MPADGRGQFWLIVGLAAVVAAAVWPRVLDRLRAGLPLAAPMLVVAASVGVLLVWHGTPAALVSAGLFGFAFLAAISGVTTIARRDLPPEQWSRALAVLTTWFAVGQSAGPVPAGLVGEGTYGLDAALIGSISVLVVGALVAAAESRPITVRKGTP
jgi:predicted MFS family arabinose efflux permease